MVNLIEEAQEANKQAFGDIPSQVMTNQEMEDLKRYIDKNMQYLNNVKTFQMGLDKATIRMDNSGISIDMDTEDLAQYLTYKKRGITMAYFSHRRYAVTGVEITDFRNVAVEMTGADRDTYNTLAVYQSDNVTRECFLQISSSYRSSAFTLMGMQFSPHGVSAPFRVIIDNKTNGEGWIDIPRRAANPTSIYFSGAIYYNTTTNKLMVCEGSTWKTVTTS